MKPTQQTLATAGFELHRKRTRRDEFLAQMDQVVPWARLCALIEPVYPKGEGAGRPTVGLERIYFLQQWFNLSDPAVEESLYDSVSMRQFVGIDLGREAAPDETTVCKFRHLLEKHRLGQSDLCRGQCPSESPRKEVEHGHDRRCEHHRRTVLDEEQGPAA